MSRRVGDEFLEAEDVEAVEQRLRQHPPPGPFPGFQCPPCRGQLLEVAVGVGRGDDLRTTQDTTVARRRCIGSTKFGIEAHEAPAEDFPVQPSQKDGLGRMCHLHCCQYTNALRKAAVARKAAETNAPEVSPEPPAHKYTLAASLVGEG